MNGATVVSSMLLSCAGVASAVLVGAAKATRATSTATRIGHHIFDEDDDILFPVTLLRWKRCMLMRIYVCLDCGGVVVAALSRWCLPKNGRLVAAGAMRL